MNLFFKKKSHKDIVFPVSFKISFPQLIPCHFLIYNEKIQSSSKKIRYMAPFELDGFFHDKILWHRLPLLPGISITFYYTSDPLSLHSSYRMTSSMNILCIYDVSPNVGIYNYMPNDLSWMNLFL